MTMDLYCSVNIFLHFSPNIPEPDKLITRIRFNLLKSIYHSIFMILFLFFTVLVQTNFKQHSIPNFATCTQFLINRSVLNSSHLSSDLKGEIRPEFTLTHFKPVLVFSNNFHLDPVYKDNEIKQVF